MKTFSSALLYQQSFLPSSFCVYYQIFRQILCSYYLNFVDLKIGFNWKKIKLNAISTYYLRLFDLSRGQVLKKIIRYIDGEHVTSYLFSKLEEQTDIYRVKLYIKNYGSYERLKEKLTVSSFQNNYQFSSLLSFFPMINSQFMFH